MKKFIVLCFAIIFSTEIMAQPNPDVECYGSGYVTHLVYANGVNWSETEAADNIDIDIPKLIDKNRIDPKGNIETHSAYNHARGFHWDILEAFAQLIINEGGEDENTAYSLVFKALFFRVNLTASNPLWAEYGSFDKIMETFLDPMGVWVNSYEENKNAFENITEADTNKLVKIVAEKLIAGDRVVAIGDSQGTFFLNELYRRLENHNIPQDTINHDYFDFEEQQKLLGSVHIAAATGPNNPQNKTVLHPTDIIKLVGFLASGSNVAETTFFEDIPRFGIENDKRSFVERGLNHSLTKTYLNIEGTDFPALNNLKTFTINSIYEVADMLPLPCVYCQSAEFPDGQEGVETPDYGFVADTALVTGNVILRDGVEICGESVIEVLDDNLLIMDRSTLWNVKMSVSGFGPYTGEGYIGDSKLSNLEIRDSSTFARFGSRGAVVDGGIIINDGTDLSIPGRADVSYSTLNNVNVYNSQISNSTLSGLSIEKSIVDFIFIDAGSGVNASYIYDSNVVNSYVGNSRIERSSIINSDILDNSEIIESEIVGNTTRTLIRGSRVYYSGVTDSTLANTWVYSSSVTGSSLSGSNITACSINGASLSNFTCYSGETWQW